MPKSRHIPRSVVLEVRRRSNDYCECCGADCTYDRHHVIPFHLGGPHASENILALCPTCHRQIGGYLTQTQQQQLKSWHRNNVSPNRGTNSNIGSIYPILQVGTVTFMNTNNILSIDGQNVLRPIMKNDRLYLNIIMLERFDPKLLVLDNRVIVNSSCRIITEEKRIEISSPCGLNLVIDSSNILTTNGRTTFCEKLITFDESGINFDNNSFNGGLFSGMHTAISLTSNEVGIDSIAVGVGAFHG